MFSQILDLIKEYDTIIIHRHSNPDGDAIGSQVGLKNIIKHNFPQKKVYAVGDLAKRYSFVKDSECDQIEDELYSNALAIILDTSASALISDDRYKLAKATARFDHHIFCEKIADVEHTDTTQESCCGLIAQFARECGLALNDIAAEALFTGMVTDSGRFKYDSVNSNTFLNASFLMEHEINTNEIYKNLYADDYEYLKLRAQFTLKINFAENGVAYIYTPYDEFLSYGRDSFTISRGMVAVMADIKGVNTWVNFTEQEDSVLCEIRSNTYNINPVAVKYGGGGHAKASGATLKNKEQAFALLSDLIALKENV